MDTVALGTSVVGIASQVTDIARLLKSILARTQKILKTEQASLETQYIELALEHNEKQFQSWRDVWTSDIKLLCINDTIPPAWSIDGGEDIKERLRLIETECDEITGVLENCEKLKMKEVKRPVRWSFSFLTRRKQEQTSIEQCCRPLRSKIERVSHGVNVLLAISSISHRSAQYHERKYQPYLPKGGPLASCADLRASKVECQRFFNFCTSDPAAKWLDLEMVRDPDITGANTNLEDACRHLQRCHVFYSLPGSSDTRGVVLRPYQLPIPDNQLLVLDLTSIDEMLSAQGTPILSVHNNQADHSSYFAIERSEIAVLNSSSIAYDFRPLEGPKLSMVKRLDFARVAAQYFMVFMGTSWASHFNRGSFSNSTTANGPAEYKFHIDLMKDSDRGARQDQSVNEQIFNFGVLLVENSIDHAPASEELKKIQVQAETLLRVQSVMGIQYRQVCEFCLSKAYIPIRRDEDVEVPGMVDSEVGETRQADLLESKDRSLESVCSESSWLLVDERAALTPAQSILRSLQEDLTDFHREVFLRLNEACNAVASHGARKVSVDSQAPVT